MTLPKIKPTRLFNRRGIFDSDEFVIRFIPKIKVIEHYCTPFTHPVLADVVDVAKRRKDRSNAIHFFRIWQWRRRTVFGSDRIYALPRQMTRNKIKEREHKVFAPIVTILSSPPNHCGTSCSPRRARYSKWIWCSFSWQPNYFSKRETWYLAYSHWIDTPVHIVE